MSTAEQREQWRRWAGDSSMMFYQGSAIVTQLLDDVDRLTAERDALAAELAEVRAQTRDERHERAERHRMEISKLEQQNHVLLEQLVKADLVTPRRIVIQPPRD